MARELAVTHPDARCELDFQNPLQLTVATILSAQTTDARVNEVTPKLFARYPTAADYAAADPAELEELLRPTGIYRNKGKALVSLGRQLEERVGGEWSRRVEDLLRMPWIGRTTVHVIIGQAFGVLGQAV